jgi:hypothetical protein
MTTRQASKEFGVSIRRVQQICKANPECGTPPDLSIGRVGWTVDRDRFEIALNKNNRESGKPSDGYFAELMPDGTIKKLKIPFTLERAIEFKYVYRSGKFLAITRVDIVGDKISVGLAPVYSVSDEKPSECDCRTSDEIARGVCQYPGDGSRVNAVRPKIHCPLVDIGGKPRDEK